MVVPANAGTHNPGHLMWMTVSTTQHDRGMARCAPHFHRVIVRA